MEPNVHRFHDLLQKLFDVRGHGAGQTVLDDVFPVLNLLEESPDLMWSRGEHMFAARITSGAVAGNFSACGIQAPPGQLLVVERVLAIKAVTGTVAWGTLNPGRGTAAWNASQYLDGRRVTALVPDPIPALGTNAIVAAVPVALWGQAGTAWSSGSEVYGAGAVLSPGTELYVVNNTVNEALTCQFYGWARTMNEGEAR